MRYFIYILLYLKILVISADDAASTDKYLSCEYSDTDWQALDIDQLYTCDILTDTIDSPNYKIKYESSETEKVEGLRFLDNKNVKFLPNNIGEIFPNLKALAVSGTYLNTLNSNDLKSLTKLRYATFANSDLNVIEDGTFKDLSALEELDFRDSNIRIIEEDAFHGMTSLKTLYLSGNKLNSLEPKTFDGLESLHSLSLELNHLEYIDENLFETNENLADIWLNKNKIIGLPYKVFEKIPKLAYVDLQENICIDYAYDIDNFDELKDDCESKCTAVPPPREVHTKPDKVDELIEEIVENKPNETFRNEYKIDGDIDTGTYSQSINIIELPDEIDESVIMNDVSSKIVECQTTQMVWKLSNSELPTCVIENQIIDSKDFNIAHSADGNAIKAMSFAQNKYIKFLPQNIGTYAPNLEEFSARNTSLRVISKNNFAGLKHLKSLNLADNKIKFIDSDAFDDLTSLEELDLSGNELSTLDSEIFRKLKNLKTLRIGSNQIHSFPPNLFQNLRNLVNISISHQHISDINANTFKANTKLKNVWMNSNKLKSLSPNMFTSKLKDLEYVDMRDNKCIDGFYDQSHFQQMKTEIHEKCGKKYIVPLSTKLEDQKKKGKKPKKDSKKNKNPKVEAVDESKMEEKEVICDYEEVFWPHLNKTLKTCVVNEAIDNSNYLISANPLFSSDFVNADTIEAISFKNNKNVKYLPKNLFNIFPNLVEFSAENAGLTKINPQDFKGLKKLKSLNLSANGLTNIDRESFKDLTSLEELILDDNDIEEFEEETFTHTKKLKKFRMKGNKLKTVHETWLKDMPDLEEVSFTFSDPVVLQKQIFDKNPNLKDIDWNGIHYDGKLSEIDDAVVDTTEVNESRKEISCKYEEVPIPESGETMTVCKIDESEIIDDSDYIIKSSPHNNKVKKFVMYNNPNIKFLPRNLGKTFPMLEEIDVDNTALGVIDRESFYNLPLMKTLKMSRNKIQNFESDTFDDIPQLEELDLSDNDVELIKDGAFYKMNNLKDLKLGNNKINSIDPKTFKVMKNLRKISLPGNNIEFLDRHTFKNNPNIEEIDLSENDIESLNPRTFEKLRKLKRVLFKGNKCLDEEFNSSELSKLKNDIFKNCKMPKKSTKEVSCELEDVEEITSDVVDITTCVVDEDVEIDEPGYKFTIDTSAIDPSQIRTLSISNNPKIKFLPENIGQLFPNLENVMITNTSIEDVPDETFNDMDKVKYVDLSRNKIERLNPNSFTGLSSINKINLSDNGFEELDHVPFTKIPSISAIDITGNKLKPAAKKLLIKNLPDIDFEGIDEIEDPVTEMIEEITDKEVTCDNIEQNHAKGTFTCTMSSQIIDSPDYFLKLPESLSFNSLTLVGNDNIQYIPKNLNNVFPNVKHLNFHKTGIKEVPQDIKNFNNLETLDLSNNKIKTLKPSDFHNMPALKKLSLDGNLIEDVDESAFDLPSLEWINLSGNKISSIPSKTFHKLRKVNWISLEDNDDSFDVDESIFESIPSKNIEISYTKGGKKRIIEVNADFDEDEESDDSEEYEEVTEIQVVRRKTTKKIKKVRPQEEEYEVEETTEYFTTNEVTCELETDDKLHVCVIKDQPIKTKGFKVKSTPDDSKIKEFKIENNENVEFLPENIGELFPNLQKLTVRNTSVSEIPGDIFKKLHKLKTLELPNNQLSELDPEILSDAPILEEVNLSGNIIKKIPDDIFKFVPDLKIVELDNNEITDLDPKIFESVPNLSTLSFEGNNIPMELSEDMFTNNPFLKIFRSNSSMKTTTIKSSVVDESKELECDVGWKRVESGSESSVSYSESDEENGDKSLTCILEDQSILDEEYRIKSTSKNPEIKAFSIENNHDVKFLPENIGDLFPNLEKIFIKNTSISKVPNKVMKKLKKLKVLNLPDNNLLELDPEMLDDIPLLEEVDFSGNKIEKLPKNIFKKVPKLKIISFENNEFTEMEPEIFESLPHLTKITMDGDDLPDEFTQKLMKKHPQLKIIKSTIKTATMESIIETEELEEVECDTDYVDFESIDGDNDVSNIFTCVITDQEIKKRGSKIKPTPNDKFIEGIKIANSKDIRFIPENIGELFPNVQKISIQNTSVREIPNDIFRNINNLNLLDISNNKIKELVPEIFYNLPQLEEVDLSGNEIQEIPENLFNNLPELKVIDLGDNEITNLDPELFKSTPKLTKLILDENKLPDEVIEELIKKIPSVKIPTSKTTILSITTTEPITDFPVLKEITCDTEYSEWKSIDNDVSSIFTCVIKDQEIDDTEIKIKPTPYDYHIHGIKIENNKDVKFVPENIGELFPNIQKISIQNTSVSKIPNEALKNLDNLKVLDLSNNDIKELDPEILNNIPMLEEIDLSGNKIQELPDELFKNVPELKAVDLTNNEITKLDPEIFESTPHLKKLVIDGNDLLNDLNEDSFVYNPMLEISKEVIPQKTTAKSMLEKEVTEELLEEFITVTPIISTTQIVTEKSTHAPVKTTASSGPHGDKGSTTTKRTPVSRTTSRYTTKTSSGRTTAATRPTKSPDGNAEVSGVRRTTQRPRFKPEISSYRTTTPKVPLKTVKCGIIYETSEPNSKSVIKCDMSDQKIEDPEVSFADIPNGKEVEVLKFDNNKNIKYLPDNIALVFPNLKEITAENSAIELILPGDFEDLNKLENIVLSGNDLKSIEPETFDGLDNLKNLDLSNNQIEFIDEDAFGRLPSLKNLDLDNNEITFIHPKTFRNIPKLETLKIEGNNIPSLHENVFSMNPKLKKVKHSIPSFVLLTTTQKPQVKIHTTFIKSSTTAKPKILQTTTQKIIDTRTTTIPRRQKVSPFKEVECDYENIQWDFSDDVLFSCDLKDAVIDDTNYVIKQSPKNKRIKGLSLVDSKKVKFLPQNIDKAFPNLVEISTFNSSIKHIPKESLKNLPKLRGLNLMSSGISTIAPNAFDEIPSVEYIELSDNNIKDLHPDLFKKVPALKYLYLNDNNIKSLDSNIFENLPELRNISLEGNEIKEVNKKLFKNNYELQNVWLNGNRISAIDPTIFDGKRALEYVDLRENDCIEEFFEGYEIEGIRNILKNKCKTPEEDPTEEVIRTTSKPIREHKATTQKIISGGLNPYPTRKPPHSISDDQKFTTRPPYQISTEKPAEPQTIPSYNYRTSTYRSPSSVTETPAHSSTVSSLNYRTSTRRSSNSFSERPLQPTRAPQHFIGTTEIVTKRPKEVKCSLNYHEFPGTRLEIYTCFISEQTINDPEYIIKATPHDEFVTGVAIDDNNKVKFLPQNIGEIFPNLKHLSAKHNSIENVPSLNNLENVKTLDLSDNGLKIIDPEVLKRLPLLEDLNLSGNQIPLFINSTFDNLPNLKTLDISRNNIAELSPEIFNKLPELQKVSLDNNELTELPEKIFNKNPKLQVVNLNGNKINRISPETFENLPNLGEVNLEENPCINGVYKSGAFYAMKSDVIKGCAPDEYVTPSVKEVMTTTIYSIEKLKPNAIECNYGDTHSSTYDVYLPSCMINEDKIVEVPEWEIKEMPANRRVKRFMILDNDKIEKLPKNLGEAFPDLNDIIVTGAPIKSILPTDFKDLKNLKSISITGSSIKVLDPETFKGAPLLEDLDLSNNNIRHIDDGAFEGIKRLKNLDLSGNKLPKISKNILKPLPELKTIKLTGNDLQNVNSDLFKGNPQLYKVNLDENNLRSIDPDAFDRLPHLININLNKNDCIDRSFGASNMHMMRKIVNENCQPYDALKNELKTCKKEIENFISRPKENDVGEKDTLKDVIKKSENKIKQLNIQLNKLRNALNAEKAMLRKEVEKSKNLETELEGIKKKCARIDENHNVLIDLNCNYNELNNEKYSCNARDLKIKIENSTIENPNGNHKHGKRDADVNSLIISNQDVKYIPNGISNHFPQLKELTIENSGLVKINQAPLRNLPHLNKLIIRGNDIYHIEPTALNDIPQLEHLDLSQNNIMDIPIKFLEEMPKLKILNLNDNALLSLPQNIIPNVNSLKTFTVGNNNLNFIDPRIFKRLDSAGVVDFTNNKCIDKKFNENDDDRRDYMSFIGIVSIKCTNNIDDSGEDGFCTGRKI
ncbi:hypothetical protein ACKWTF_005238 [Chironomus riparius]